MEFFKRKNKQVLPPLWHPGELEELTPSALNYDTVLDWLVGLSDEDYQKVCSVAAVHRAASKQEAEILGKDAKPSTFINPPEPEPMPEPRNFLDDEDDLGFLEDEPKKVDSVKKPKAKRQ